MLLPEEKEQLEKENHYTCYLCKYYFGGTWGGHLTTPEPAECTNDLAYRNSFLPTWPFKNGCKYHSKREINA